MGPTCDELSHTSQMGFTAPTAICSFAPPHLLNSLTVEAKTQSHSFSLHIYYLYVSHYIFIICIYPSYIYCEIVFFQL